MVMLILKTEYLKDLSSTDGSHQAQVEFSQMLSWGTYIEYNLNDFMIL